MNPLGIFPNRLFKALGEVPEAILCEKLPSDEVNEILTFPLVKQANFNSGPVVPTAYFPGRGYIQLELAGTTATDALIYPAEYHVAFLEESKTTGVPEAEQAIVSQ